MSRTRDEHEHEEEANFANISRASVVVLVVVVVLVLGAIRSAIEDEGRAHLRERCPRVGCRPRGRRRSRPRGKLVQHRGRRRSPTSRTFPARRLSSSWSSSFSSSGQSFSIEDEGEPSSRTFPRVGCRLVVVVVLVLGANSFSIEDEGRARARRRSPTSRTFPARRLSSSWSSSSSFVLGANSFSSRGRPSEDEPNFANVSRASVVVLVVVVVLVLGAIRSAIEDEGRARARRGGQLRERFPRVGCRSRGRRRSRPRGKLVQHRGRRTSPLRERFPRVGCRPRARRLVLGAFSIDEGRDEEEPNFANISRASVVVLVVVVVLVLGANSFSIEDEDEHEESPSSRTFPARRLSFSSVVVVLVLGATRSAIEDEGRARARGGARANVEN